MRFIVQMDVDKLSTKEGNGPNANLDFDDIHQQYRWIVLTLAQVRIYPKQPVHGT